VGQSFYKGYDVYKIVVDVDRVFALEEERGAFEHLTAGRHFGKIAVEIDK
jgi:hypothetical protein